MVGWDSYTLTIIALLDDGWADTVATRPATICRRVFITRSAGMLLRRLFCCTVDEREFILTVQLVCCTSTTRLQYKYN